MEIYVVLGTGVFWFGGFTGAVTVQMTQRLGMHLAYNTHAHCPSRRCWDTMSVGNKLLLYGMTYYIFKYLFYRCNLFC